MEEVSFLFRDGRFCADLCRLYGEKAFDKAVKEDQPQPDDRPQPEDLSRPEDQPQPGRIVEHEDLRT